MDRARPRFAGLGNAGWAGKTRPSAPRIPKGASQVSENICLFNPSRSSDLICENFVWERSDCAREPQTAAAYAVHLVGAGAGTLTCEGRDYPLTAGDVFFVCPGETFRLSGNAAFSYFYITFRGRRAVEVAERVGLPGEGRVFAAGEGMVRFWEDSLSRADARNLDLMSEAVLLYTLARLAPQKAGSPGAVAAVLQLTDECFTDPDLSLAAVSGRLGYDPKYLSYAFRRARGVTYSRYLRDLRVKRAAFLMEQGVSSIKNVARLSGFRDPLYFSRVFSAAEGVSPREYLSRVRSRSGNS